jgi:hypothetical protein
MEIILLGGYTNNRKGSFALFLDDWLTFKPNGQAIQSPSTSSRMLDIGSVTREHLDPIRHLVMLEGFQLRLHSG